DSLMPSRPFGTEDAMRADARLRRCTALGMAQWGMPLEDLQRQLLAPSEIPSGLIWLLCGNCNRARLRFPPVLATRDPSGCRVWRFFLSPFPLVLSASRCGKLVARSFAVRLSIWK